MAKMEIKTTYYGLIAVALILTAVSAVDVPCSSPTAVDFESCIELGNNSQPCFWCVIIDDDVVGISAASFCVSRSHPFVGTKSCVTRVLHEKNRQHKENDDATPSDDATDDLGPLPNDDQSGTDDASPDDDQAASDDAIPVNDDQAPPDDDKDSPSDDSVPNDDQTPSNDDASPPDDDASPPDDDKTPANDDIIPDDFWTCLQVKSSHNCTSSNCTWCDTKAGFGVCMTGPAADAAKNSSWFTCTTETVQVATLQSKSLRASVQKRISIVDPYDPSCIQAFLNDPTESGCEAASDESGQTCEWCSVSGMADVCLTPDQAAMGAGLGISCDDDRVAVQEASPYDFSCALSYLQDQSEESCLKTLDADGIACEFCSVPGSLDICLTHDQVELAEQLGIKCPTKGIQAKKLKDPYDTACLQAFLQDQTKEGCVAATDSDGDPCKFCTLQGSFSLCLDEEQAEFSEQFGIDCDDGKKDVEVRLPPDFLSCLESYQEDDCRKTDCTWCNTQVGIGFCLANNAAEATKQCSFFDCEFGAGSNSNIIEAQY